MLEDRIAGGRLRHAIRAHDVLVLAMPSGEPDLSSLRPVISQLSRFAPDWIVAAGGGSVLDGAKVAWVCYEQPDADFERLTRPFALAPLRGRARFAAVPTTAGTGSEVSSSALFTLEPGEGKRALISHHLLPDVVVLDPGVTCGVPRPAGAAAGLDALAHAVEGYVSRFANPLADLMAEQAVRVLLADLEASLDAPDDAERRLRVMHAALMAGWVQNLKVPGIGHAIAHQLARFGLAHGRCTGALLVPAMRFNAAEPGVQASYDRLAHALDFAGASGLMARIEALCANLGVALPPATELPGERTDLARAALDDPCARANPRSLDELAVVELLATVLDHAD